MSNRRQFLKSCAATGAFLGLGDGGLIPGLPVLRAAESQIQTNFVRFSPDIEPLVRLLEESSRDRLLEEIAHRIKTGTSYHEVLTSLFLAGVRNIQPRPVGFKFHAVLVVHSAHLASQNSPDSDRWLPIFWALDYFKSSQARDVSEGDWILPSVDERMLPSASKALALFREAMDQWDETKADSAVAGLARSAGNEELFDIFCRYGARDFRDIGHKAIYVANAWRTLKTIGWQHAEPVLRSLAYALLEGGEDNPAQNDYEADRPGRRNLQALKEIRTGWQQGEIKPEASLELLNVLRQGSWQDASKKVIDLLNRGIDPQSIWDAHFQHAAEMMMRRPAIVALHACTTSNAMHYLYQHTNNDETRRYLLLQNSAFLTMFRRAGGVGEGISIDTFNPVEGTPSLEDVLSDVGNNRILSAQKTLAYLEQSQDPQSFIAAAQRMIYLKGNDSHDYKFSSAMLEDYRHLSPEIRARFLSSTVFWLDGHEKPDNRLVARTRAALS
ncbi:MAG: twin-arginine translocation signal domain-containing protein [Verrucomicrobia bacterium]|nr:twin-arginine translocation signal domain-containing protein [Verrucomicrobiota bacterium]MDA1066230.1 twin-arginine translocation signal domain-containing protein [Verrucomicrobiota bacterium]